LALSGYDQDKVNFAVALLQNDLPENQTRGVSLLKAIYTSIQRVSQYFTDADKDLARHCLYQLTLGYFILHKYTQSIEYGKLLLQITPNHQQVKAIITLIEEGITSAQESESKEKKGLFSRGKRERTERSGSMTSPSSKKMTNKRSETINDTKKPPAPEKKLKTSSTVKKPVEKEKKAPEKKSKT